MKDYWFLVDDEDPNEPEVQQISAQNVWDVYHLDEYQGRIEWDGEQILISGPISRPSSACWTTWGLP